MDSKYLESENTFSKVMEELRNHSETCKNEMCREHKWHKKDVIEVEQIGKKDEPFWNGWTIGIGVVGILSLCVILYVKNRKAIPLC